MEAKRVDLLGLLASGDFLCLRQRVTFGKSTEAQVVVFDLRVKRGHLQIQQLSRATLMSCSLASVHA